MSMIQFPVIDPVATGANICRLRKDRGLTVRDLQHYFGFEEPQAIYNRDKPVAVLISAQEYEEFKAWQAQKKRPTLAEQFDEIRALLAARGEDGIELPPRTTRYNPMVDDPHYWD